jgi:predicted alpha/beta-hydrolase family hydrolase
MAEIGTTYGTARVVVESAGEPSFLLALTHGAGGDADSPDLLAVRDAALNLGGTIALVTQPYRVRGARAPGSAERQDAAWVEIIAALRSAARAVSGQAGGTGMGELGENIPADVAWPSLHPGTPPGLPAGLSYRQLKPLT